jgi:hypothetical protein
MMREISILSVRQPFAYWISTGRKTVELRSRRTSYRGPLYIQVAKTPHELVRRSGPEEAELCRAQAGLLICRTMLTGCRLATGSDEQAARFPPDAGDFAWELKGAAPLSSPFPIKGQLGIFRRVVDDALLGLLPD